MRAVANAREPFGRIVVGEGADRGVEGAALVGQVLVAGRAADGRVEALVDLRQVDAGAKARVDLEAVLLVPAEGHARAPARVRLRTPKTGSRGRRSGPRSAPCCRRRAAGRRASCRFPVPRATPRRGSRRRRPIPARRSPRAAAGRPTTWPVAGRRSARGARAATSRAAAIFRTDALVRSTRSSGVGTARRNARCRRSRPARPRAPRARRRRRGSPSSPCARSGRSS